MADPFEEFEFKPLTEGLGFHKKAEKIKSDIRSTDLGAKATSAAIPPLPPRSVLFGEEAEESFPPARETRSATQSISELMASLPPSLDFLDDKPDLTRRAAPSTLPSSASTDRPEIYQPLAGRKEEKSQISNVLPAPGTRAGSMMSTSPTAATIPVPTLGNPTPYREKLNEGYARAFPRAEKSKSKATDATTDRLIPVSANLAAGFIDAMVITGVSTIFLVCILSITRIDLIGMLGNARTDSAMHVQLAFLGLAVMQMYMLISRAFFGASLGEWAFELQMGSDEIQKRAIYPVLVVWRTLLTTITGIIVLPLLSFGIGRDLSRYLTGLQLYRRP